MKNICFALLATAAASAVAQAPFTIVKPQEGEKVRETVQVQFPDGSVPPGSFIGIKIDDKFVEATVPRKDEELGTLVYELNTKARAIIDGTHTLTVMLYGNVDGQPKIVETSSVTVSVQNSGDIAIPEGGVDVKYKFVTGNADSYQVDFGIDLSTLSETQNQIGGRAAQLPVAFETTRMLIAVDDVKEDGNGLVRTQLLPIKGKDYSIITTPGENEPAKHSAAEFAPIYRILTPSGEEVYGDAPTFYGAFGSFSPGESDTDLYVLIPMPRLPEDPLYIGDSFMTSIGFVGSLAKDGKISEWTPARGTLESVEWELGKPCAKLHYELVQAMGSGQTENLQVAGREFRDNDRVKFVQNIWISLDDGKLVKTEIIMEADRKIETQPVGGTAGAGAGAGGRGGGPTASGGLAGSGGDGGATTGPGIGFQGRGSRGGGPTMGGGGLDQGGQRGGQQARGGQRGGQRGGGGGDLFVRQKLYVVITLEK